MAIARVRATLSRKKVPGCHLGVPELAKGF